MYVNQTGETMPWKKVEYTTTSMALSLSQKKVKAKGNSKVQVSNLKQMPPGV